MALCDAVTRRARRRLYAGDDSIYYGKRGRNLNVLPINLPLPLEYSERVAPAPLHVGFAISQTAPGEAVRLQRRGHAGLHHARYGKAGGETFKELVC